MCDETTIERRLITLEQAVSDLQHKLDRQSPTENWLDLLIGSISDEEAFLQALDYGRAFRRSDHAMDENNQRK